MLPVGLTGRFIWDQIKSMWRRPNLTGVWVLNAFKSDINFSGVDTLFRITHKEPEFEIEITHTNLHNGRFSTGTISLSADAKPCFCLVAHKPYWAALRWRWRHLRLVLKTATNNPDTCTMVFGVSPDTCTLYCDHRQSYGNSILTDRMVLDRKQDDAPLLVRAQ